MSRLTVNGTSNYADMVVEDNQGQSYEIRIIAPEDYFGSVFRITPQPEYTSAINTISSGLAGLISFGISFR